MTSSWDLSTVIGKALPTDIDRLWIGACQEKTANGNATAEMEEQFNTTDLVDTCQDVLWSSDFDAELTPGDKCVAALVEKIFKATDGQPPIYSEVSCSESTNYICKFDNPCQEEAFPESCFTEKQIFMDEEQLCPSPKKPLSFATQLATSILRKWGCIWLLSITTFLIVAFVAFKAFRYERMIHMWQEISLLVAHCFVLFAAERTEVLADEQLCRITATCLFYFFTAYFMFLLLDAFHSYFFTTNVLYSKPFISSKLAVFVIGFGLAAAASVPPPVLWKDQLPAAFVISQKWLLAIIPVSLAHWIVQSMALYYQRFELHVAVFTLNIILPILLFMRDLTQSHEVRAFVLRVLKRLCPCCGKSIDHKLSKIQRQKRRAKQGKRTEDTRPLRSDEPAGGPRLKDFLNGDGRPAPAPAPRAGVGVLGVGGGRKLRDAFM